MNIIALLLSVVSCCLAQTPQTVCLPVIADTSLQAHASELACNSGAMSQIRIKGNEHFILFRFDTQPVHNWHVQSAKLFIKPSHEHKLRTIGISTVSADWEEGTGTGNAATDGCTFLRATWPDIFWAGSDSDFLSVALTYGNTLVGYADVQKETDGWLSLEIPASLIQHVIAGLSYGLCLSDEKGQTYWNNDIYSREQNASAPYLIVTGAPINNPVPLSQDIALHNLTTGDIFELPRYAIPQNGLPDINALHRQGFIQPDTEYEARVSVRDELGQVSKVTTILLPVYKLPPEPRVTLASEEKILPGEPVQAGNLSAWACPAEWKIHPVSGNALEEVGQSEYAGQFQGEYQQKNPVWNKQGIVLKAAAGEVLAIQVVVEKSNANPCDLNLTWLPAASQTFTPQIFRNWYVYDGAWYSEYLIPQNSQAHIPASDNLIPGQKNQSFTLLWQIPFTAIPGEAKGLVQIKAAGNDVINLPVNLTIYPFVLPREVTFDVSLNCYGRVAEAPDWSSYLVLERKYFQLAHDLRATLTPLGYSHGGRIDYGWAPEISGTGDQTKVTDWSLFDEHFGPYLDGSAFSGERAGVPVTHLYLPLHENWPATMETSYSAGNELKKYPDNIALHAMTTPPIEQAFNEESRQAFRSVSRQFAEHFTQQNWLQTDFQFYLNDKYYYKDEEHGFRGVSWWLLDEPMHRDDWLALAYFSDLFHQGVDGSPARMIFRGDISRPQWQRDWLDGKMELMCVASELFAHPEHCQRLQDKFGTILWHYGESNPISESNLTAEGWPLSAYCAGADGIVPWNVIGGAGAFDTPTPTALFVPGGRFGIERPVISLRLLALCRGQQDVEYANLLGKIYGYNRHQINQVIQQSINLTATHNQQFVDDAGRIQFTKLSGEDFYRLRENLANLIEIKLQEE